MKAPQNPRNQKRIAQLEALRRILSDGQWHSRAALQNATGPFLRGLLKGLHADLDVRRSRLPIHFAEQRRGKAVAYRQVATESCALCAPRLRRIAKLEAQLAALKARAA